jgi:hypothetical protein
MCGLYLNSKRRKTGKPAVTSCHLGQFPIAESINIPNQHGPSSSLNFNTNMTLINDVINPTWGCDTGDDPPNYNDI